jgi:hypothetical protein
LKIDLQENVAAGRRSFGLLNTVLSRVFDPLSIVPDLDDWSLTEEDIRADLEYGRD